MNRIWDFEAFGKKTALVDDTGVTVRYEELADLQKQLTEGAGAGELTMMLCENSIGALAGYAALINSGHPMMMLSAGSTRLLQICSAPKRNAGVLDASLLRRS